MGPEDETAATITADFPTRVGLAMQGGKQTGKPLGVMGPQGGNLLSDGSGKKLFTIMQLFQSIVNAVSK